MEMALQEQQLRHRTKASALRIVRLYRTLPTTPDAQAIGKQLGEERYIDRSKSPSGYSGKIQERLYL
jgi:hypothetical protein